MWSYRQVEGRWLCRCLMLLSLLMLCAQSAIAKPTVLVNPRTEQAKQEVLTALSVGNTTHAEEIIERAFRENPDPALLYQLGLVAQAQGRPVAALDVFRRYQELVGAAASADATDTIQHLTASLPPSVSVLNVIANPGMVLRMDDRLVGVLPLATPVLVTAGTHHFRLESRKERYESGPLAMPEGREAELRLTPGSGGKAVALLSISPIMMLVIQPMGLPVAGADAVTKALVAAARRNHQAPLAQERFATLLRTQPADCLQQPDCRFVVAERADARSILSVLVKEEQSPSNAPSDAGGGCSLSLEYLDVNAGQVAAQGSTQSHPCSGPPLTEALTATLQQILTASGQRTRGMISIISTPAGAQVRVDGLIRGQTPYLKASFSGPHEIVLDKPGFSPVSTTLRAVRGEMASLLAPLTPLPPAIKVEAEPEPAELKPPPAVVPTLVEREYRPPRPRWRLALGGVALGLGLVAAGFGVSALTQEGACADEVPMPTYENCVLVLRTNGIGAGLLVSGLAVTLSGALLLAIPEKKIRVRSFP